MTTRAKIVLYLVAILIPLNELHTMFHNYHVQFINCWLKKGFDYPYPTQWYVKNLCDNVSHIIYAVIIYILSRMSHLLRIAAGVYIVKTVLDFALFFVDCNTGNYLLIYTFISLVTLIIAHPKKKHRKKTRKTLYEDTIKEIG